MRLADWSIGRKLGLITFLLGLPLLLSLGFLLNQKAADVNQLKSQKVGVDCLRLSLQTLVHVQRARGSASAFLNGDKSFAVPLSKLQEQATADLAALTELGDRGGPGTRVLIAECARLWQTILSDFERLTAAESFARHTQLASQLLTLAKQIRDGSGMLGDGRLENYYLMDSMVETLPVLTETIGQLRARGSGVLARKQLSEDARTQLVALLTTLDTTQAEAERELKIIAAHRPELKSQLETESGQVASQVSDFRALLEREVLNTNPPTLGAQPYFAKATEVIDGVNHLSETVSASFVQELDRDLAAATRVSLLLTVSALALLVLTAALLTSIIGGITRSLRRAVVVSDHLTRGDLSVDIEAGSQDEVGVLLRAMQNMVAYFRSVAEVADRLAAGEAAEIKLRSEQDQLGHSFNKMVQNLNEMAEMAGRLAAGDLRVDVRVRSDRDVLGLAFRKMVEHKRRMLAELIRGVGELSSAAAEMAASSTQQSTSMAEQASALQEMSSTLEEMRAMVHQASDRARSVVGVSEHSLTVSDNGQQALDQALEAMVRIREQIESVTHSILDLSHKTQQIGDITESVRDIAEQSNLLAVNAAVEASKAGEAGRGFGVVAIEVKSLANQSKKATGTVRSILHEIQQATSSTVMGIEEGSKRVQAGVQGVQQVGEDIRQLYGIIVEACDATRQISSASQQQVTGIEQISLAVRNISEVASELVSATRQQSSTAHSLSGLAASIDQIVQHYQLPPRAN